MGRAELNRAWTPGAIALLAACLLVPLAACDAPSTASDATVGRATDARQRPVDAAGTDARPRDATREDAAPPDARIVDARTVDARIVDARIVDATPADAQAVDANTVDAGPCDPCAPDCCPDPSGPLCGANGLTYARRCDADCAGVAIAAEGPCSACAAGCPEGTRCIDDACRPEPRAIPCAPDGTCPEGRSCSPDQTCVPAPDCGCPISWNFVCGADGQNYDGVCDAECRGVEVVSQGRCLPCAVDRDCPPSALCEEGTCAYCDCRDDFELVCAINGITYASRCRAHCAHVEISHPGLCQDACPGPSPLVRFVNRDPAACFAIEHMCPGGGAPFRADCGCGCILPQPPCQGPDCPSPVCGADADCAAGTVCTDGRCQPCSCAEGGPLVCASDRLSYPNACTARCNRAEVVHEGPCPIPCPNDLSCGIGNRCVNGYCELCTCEPLRDLVCGSDLRTHLNYCDARCAHIYVLYPGPCNEPCPEECLPGFVCQAGFCSRAE